MPLSSPLSVSHETSGGRDSNRQASAAGSIKLASLFFTFPTRVLTGQHVISSAG
jgi:hypothetical protein